MRDALRGLIVGACCASAIAACAMGRAPRSSGAPSPSVSQAVMPPSDHQAIVDLDAQIAAGRDKLGLPLPALPLDTGSATRMADVPPASTDATCHHGDGDACHDTCALADDICVNAEKICQLAKQLPGDDWAAGKCTSGAQSCDAAHARCCGCQ